MKLSHYIWKRPSKWNKGYKKYNEIERKNWKLVIIKKNKTFEELKQFNKNGYRLGMSLSNIIS